MKNRVENGVLIIEVEGRIDSVNAADFESEIRQILQEHPDHPVILDAERMEYISSSGLRVMMKLSKEGILQSVRNVTPEVYDIFEVTGMNTLFDVQKQKRRLSVEGCEIIGKGTFGTVYRLDDDTVVKVFADGEASLPMIEWEKERARAAFLLGIPTAIPFDIVQVGDQYGAVYEMIRARNCIDRVREDPASLDWLIPKFAELIKKVHSLESPSNMLKNARDYFLETLEGFTFLKDSVRNRMRKLLQEIPDSMTILHGDMHLKNIMISNGEMILIDMEKLCRGNPVFELASIYVTYVSFNEDEPDNAMKFHGISCEACSRLFFGVLNEYMKPADEKTIQEALLKIRTVACLRFLEELLINQASDHSELKAQRVRHAADRMEELAFQVNSLAI